MVNGPCRAYLELVLDAAEALPGCLASSGVLELKAGVGSGTAARRSNDRRDRRQYAPGASVRRSPCRSGAPRPAGRELRTYRRSPGLNGGGM